MGISVRQDTPVSRHYTSRPFLGLAFEASVRLSGCFACVDFAAGLGKHSQRDWTGGADLGTEAENPNSGAAAEFSHYPPTASFAGATDLVQFPAPAYNPTRRSLTPIPRRSAEFVELSSHARTQDSEVARFQQGLLFAGRMMRRGIVATQIPGVTGVTTRGTTRIARNRAFPLSLNRSAAEGR